MDQSELERLAADYIRSEGHLWGCRIRACFNCHSVTLTGRVFSYYQKSLAQTAIMRLIRDKSLPVIIQNNVEVC